MTISKILKDLRDNPSNAEELKAKLAQALANIKELNLSNGHHKGISPLTLQDFENLKEILKNNTTLIRLHLEDNHLGDKGAEILAEILQVNRHLISVYIANNNITDEGVSILTTALKENKVFMCLDCEQNKLMKTSSLKASERFLGDDMRVEVTRRDYLDLDWNKSVDSFWRKGNHVGHYPGNNLDKIIAQNRWEKAKEMFEKSKEIKREIRTLKNELEASKVNYATINGVVKAGAVGSAAVLGGLAFPFVLVTICGYVYLKRLAVLVDNAAYQEAEKRVNDRIRIEEVSDEFSDELPPPLATASVEIKQSSQENKATKISATEEVPETLKNDKKRVLTQ